MSKKRKPLEVVERIEDIPAFATEQEEADFWQTHQFSTALLDAAEPYSEEEAPPARPSASITLRIDPLLLERLQRLARVRGLPYQRLLKQFVEERIIEEEEAEGQLRAMTAGELRGRALEVVRASRALERSALRLAGS